MMNCIYNLAVTSIDHWIGLTGGLTGFARAGVSSMNTLLGRPVAAYTNITWLLENWIKPNTMYSECEFCPCGETPLAAASAIQDMLLDSYNNSIHVFPGTDTSVMQDVSFYQLRAQGAFLVSAALDNSGLVTFVQVESLAGEPCTVTANIPLPWAVYPPSIKLQFTNKNTANLVNFGKGDVVIIYNSSGNVIGDPLFTIKPSEGIPAQYNFWGTH